MILITGATGFVGKNLLHFLLEKGYRVRVLLRPGSRALALKDFDIEKVLCNPFNVDSLEAALKGVDTVIHCAGVLKGLRYEDYYKGNVLYTQNLLDAVKKYRPALKKFIFLSTQAVSGPSATGNPKTENDQDHPISWYGLSKLVAEKKIKESGVPYLILRPSGIYGPGDTEFFPLFKMARMGFHLMIGNGKNEINLVHVADLIRSIHLALENPIVNQTYFIADGHRYAWKEILRMVNETVEKKARFIPIPKFIVRFMGYMASFTGGVLRKPFLLNKDKAKEGVQKYWIFDTSRIRKELNFIPEILPKEGFPQTYRWYLEKGWLK